jgi:tetratricopeptide (TPR) repeat protein
MSSNAFNAFLDGRLEEVLKIVDNIGVIGHELDLEEYAQVQQHVIGTRSRLYLGKTDYLTDEYLQSVAVDPRFKAYYLAHLDRKAEVIEYLDELVQSRSPTDPHKDETWWWYDIIDLESALLVGHRKWAERVLTRFIRSGIQTTGIFFTTCIPRHLGTAATLLRRFEEAKDLNQEAIRVCTEMPFRPELALSRFQSAELQLEHFPEERTEALEHLDFAISEFKEMKMKPSLEKVLALKAGLDLY